MAKRTQLAGVAAETVAVTQSGSYVAPSGRVVSVRDAVQTACENAVLITPGDARSLRTKAERAMSTRAFRTVFEVRNETTLAAARRLAERYGPERVAALNFASAKNPGGGFLNGS